MKITDLLESNDQISTFNNAFDEHELYHAKSGAVSNGHIPFKYRSKPRDMPITIHNDINKLAEAKVGYPVRNLFFASFNHSMAEGYGPNVYNIEPLGKWHIFYADKVQDLYNDYYFSSGGIEFQLRVELRKVESEIKKQLDDVSRSDSLARFCIHAIGDFVQQSHDNTLGMFEDFRTHLKEQLGDHDYSDEVITVVDGAIEIVQVNTLADMKGYIALLKEVNYSHEVDAHVIDGEVMIYASEGFRVVSAKKPLDRPPIGARVQGFD